MSKSSDSHDGPPLEAIGWREWVSLPELGIAQIKAKIDTGARTSALHAFEVLPFTRDGALWVKFRMHPLQRNATHELMCEAAVVDERVVRDSGGHAEQRYVIETRVCLGADCWPVEVTLTSRDDMLFRMLIGRTAIRGRYFVDASRSYLTRKRP
jgi:hypothetical protein